MVKKMSDFQAGYTFVALLFFVLGIILFFVDGMLLYSIGFIVLVIMLVVVKMIWNTAGWAEETTREFR